MPFNAFSESVTVPPLHLTMHWAEGKLKRIQLDWSAERPAPDPAPRFLASEYTRPMQEALGMYFQGKPVTWPDMPLDSGGLSDFARQVLFTLRREIGWGRTISYGQLAQLCGKPGAARSVGRVMARNPWPLVVPCHRVIGSRGALTGFSGAGLPMKEFLLKTEGALAG